ncbi:MFS transporter [Sabulicella glaciei]|uniref:MFS transporter n=1 Tax=Sabulicella glaciei TaxID=2984948 RepID=A0ABT3NXN9_9PROT|nr:MFS transporter [Roseococcus sp. MDT2-1-1]MCW8086924.1 MFS transporter [Roseococcus sp. MDT2-1-1]
MSRTALWVAIISAAATSSMAMGIRQTFGLLLLPLSGEHDVAPWAFGLAVALHNLVWGLAQPVSGAMADKHGAGRVMAYGGLFYLVGCGLPALFPSNATVLIGIGLFTGLGVASAGTGMALAAIGRLAPPEKRGEYIGIASAGGSLGQAAMVPIVFGAIGWFGAAGALMTLAISALVIIPIARNIEWRPAQRAPGAAAPAGIAGLPALARNALADRDFALLTGGFFACGFQLAFLTTHLPSHIALCGLPPALGMTALMLIGLFNIPGSWFCGWLSARVKPENALGWIYMVRTVSIALFAFATPTEWGTMIFAAVMGFVWLGTVPLTSAAIARRFGVSNLGALYGVCFFSHQIGGFLGAGSGAVLYSMSGTYAVFWPVMVVVGVMASVLNWMAKAPGQRAALPA